MIKVTNLKKNTDVHISDIKGCVIPKNVVDYPLSDYFPEDKLLQSPGLEYAESKEAGLISVKRSGIKKFDDIFSLQNDPVSTRDLEEAAKKVQIISEEIPASNINAESKEDDDINAMANAFLEKMNTMNIDSENRGKEVDVDTNVNTDTTKEIQNGGKVLEKKVEDLDWKELQKLARENGLGRMKKDQMVISLKEKGINYILIEKNNN